MKRSTILGVAGLLLVGGSLSWSADNGAALYKSKCAACHGANAEGKPARKVPALTATSLDPGQIADRLTKGDPSMKAPHNKAMSGLSEQHAKAIAEYIKTLK